MRRNVWKLAVVVAVIGGTFGYTIFAGGRPVLGLDLQGGISVTLNPVRGTHHDALDTAVDIIRNRVDSLGVAEPEISRQGNTIVVDLPGVKDRAKAQKLIGKTAELTFRPVIGCLASQARRPTSTSAGATTPTTVPQGADIPTSDPATSKASDSIVAPGIAGSSCGSRAQPRYALGPAKLTGKGVSTASTRFDSGGGQGWIVDLKLTGKGSGAWDALGSENFHKPVAIVLDGVVQSAPVIQPNNSQFQSFGGSAQISGSFTQGRAKDLARLLRYGALPVRFDERNQQIQSVSPTLGKDQLRSGIAAGLIGLALVALFMLLYYRVLGIVVWVGLGLSAMALFSLVAYLGHSVGLTLTLAGVTGLIVSVGVTVDSYVVYFERLKDEVRGGRSVRAAVERGFPRAWRTIVAADLVSLISAGALYFLAIGSVRGFAFFLGLSTALDLLVAYFFMHPLVSIMARSRFMSTARFIGMTAGLDAVEPKTAPASGAGAPSPVPPAPEPASTESGVRP